jgi:hypothetical protein
MGIALACRRCDDYSLMPRQAAAAPQRDERRRRWYWWPRLPRWLKSAGILVAAVVVVVAPGLAGFGIADWIKTVWLGAAGVAAEAVWLYQQRKPPNGLILPRALAGSATCRGTTATSLEGSQL